MRRDDGEVVPEEGSPKRGRFLQTYFRLLRKQEDYLLRLTPEQRRQLERDNLLTYLASSSDEDIHWRLINLAFSSCAE
jgi:hypothetical protein